MKKPLLAVLAFVVVTTLTSLAQEPASQDNPKATATQAKPDHKSMGHGKTVTGCLQKGDEAGEYSITGDDGKTWGLRSTTVKLEKHLGHRVTVTGTPHPEKAEAQKEGQMEKAAGKEEYGDLSVTSLKMVSTTCTK